MATPRERLVAALNFLKALQDKGMVGIHTDEIPNRTYREILLKNGFIREVTKGWYIPADPSAQPGDATSMLQMLTTRFPLNAIVSVRN